MYWAYFPPRKKQARCWLLLLANRHSGHTGHQGFVPDLWYRRLWALLDECVAELVTVEELLCVCGMGMEEDVSVHPARGAKVIAGVGRRLVDVLRVVKHKVGVDACEMSLVPLVEISALFDLADADILCAHDVERLVVAGVGEEAVSGVPVSGSAH